MDVHEAIRNRRTIQRFRPGPGPEDVMTRALEAATWAPNHKTTWPFRFLRPGPETREALFRIALRHKQEKKGPSPELEAKVRGDWLVPDQIVVVVQVVASDPGRAQEDYATCACATQNLLLSLHADGVGAKWNTGKVTRDPDALRLLGLDPDTHRVVAFVLVGQPAIVPQPPRRPPLEALVRALP